VTPEAADWVFEHVLVDRQWRREGGKPSAILRRCRCQSGVCGYCFHFDHDNCVSRTIPPNPGWETSLSPPSGGLWSAVPVWLSGTPCAFRCPCECRSAPSVAPPAVLVAPAEPVSAQLDLFDLAGGGR
jgi:hypothetical protein